jgi:hypothetical protein
MKIIYLIALMPFFTSCVNNKKQISPQIHLVSSYLLDTVAFDNQKTRTEIYIVSAYNENIYKSNKLIKLFNKNIITNKASIEKNYDLYSRLFYKESAQTPIDFVDDNSFIPDYLYDHNDDFICSITMTKNIIKNDTIINWESSSNK